MCVTQHHIIRADIKSFYKSIPHHKLIDDLQKTYDDPKLLRMFKEIIKNPIETPRGDKNTVTGIALRGTLSQFFSAIYLKPLDDAFDHMDVTTFAIKIISSFFFKTKKQLNRCRRKMMNILHEDVQEATLLGGSLFEQSKPDEMPIFPHARTIRKAREQVRAMVAAGFLPKKIMAYLKNWALWWVKATAKTWDYQELLSKFIESCWQPSLAIFAKELLTQHQTTLLRYSFPKVA
jgi:hypothetical protein